MIAGRHQGFIIAILDPERKGKKETTEAQRPLQMKGKGQRKDNGVGRVASRARQGAKRKNSFSEAKRAVWRRAGGRRLAAATRDAQQQV